MDVRPGGAFRAVMVLPDGNRIDWAGEYVEVDPPARLAMTLTDNPDEYAGLPVLFDLEETADGTRLTIRQDRATSATSRSPPRSRATTLSSTTSSDVLEQLQNA